MKHFMNNLLHWGELAELFKGRITIAYLMSKYVHPMIDKGLIGLTIPNAPKSKKQKYYSIY